jgi:eukaryotic-like serine/threonine-protein kinase
MTEPATHPTTEEAATVAEPSASSLPSPSRRMSEASSGPSEIASRVTSVITPRETLHVQEIERTRVFTSTVVVFAILVAISMALIGGDPVAKRVLLVAIAAIVVSCGWLRWQVRRDEGYTVARATIVAYIAVLGAFTGVWFFGVFSPASLVLPFGLSFFSLGQDRRAAFTVYLACAVIQAGLMIAVTTGVLRDTGLVRAEGLTLLEHLVVIVLVQVVIGATYLIHSKAREATLDAIEQHDRVVRSLAHRDALLREARQDLAQAMQAGGVGRWTEEVVGGFRIGRVLGRGAMGEVYEAAREGGNNEPAAVKLLHPHVLAQADLVLRFVREARIVAGLNAANVVRVLDVSTPDAPVPWFAMERLVGQDLADHLREHKRMGLKAAIHMLRQVGLGLDAARAAGVVHRDLKPRNLFLTSTQVWKILDFGVARISNEETLTKDQIVGTPNYMAPEQANGDRVTHRTDLFALGVIAYRVLTGRPAFEGEATAEILYKVVHSMPPQPTTLAALPAAMDLVLAVALAKNPADRFDSGAELAAAMDHAAKGQVDAALRERAERLLARLPWGAQD